MVFITHCPVGRFSLWSCIHDSVLYFWFHAYFSFESGNFLCSHRIILPVKRKFDIEKSAGENGLNAFSWAFAMSAHFKSMTVKWNDYLRNTSLMDYIAKLTMALKHMCGGNFCRTSKESHDNIVGYICNLVLSVHYFDNIIIKPTTNCKFKRTVYCRCFLYVGSIFDFYRMA